MGLKNKLSKMKNFLFDDEDEDNKVDSKKSSKKEKRTEEEESEEFDNTTNLNDFFFDDDKTIEIQSRSSKKDQSVKEKTEEFDFNYEIYDYEKDMPKVKEEYPKEEYVEPVKYKEEYNTRTIEKKEEKPLLYQGAKRKEENKKFKKSPFISPVYGYLDENGNTISKEAKTIEKEESDEVNIDIVRRKAYGEVKNEETMEIRKMTVGEAEDYAHKKEIKEIEKESEEDDDMILPKVNFKEIDIDLERTKKIEKKDLKEKSKKDDDDDEDTKEQDLFKLIDNIYKEEGK